jgi:hypothetical protein
MSHPWRVLQFHAKLPTAKNRNIGSGLRLSGMEKHAVNHNMTTDEPYACST